MTISVDVSRFSLLKYMLLLSLVTCIDDSKEDTCQQLEGKKGRNVTLPCNFQSKISRILLEIGTKTIPYCTNESHYCRIRQTGPCNMTLNDLIFRNATKYTLKIYPNGGRELYPETFSYQLHIRDNISLNTGDNLILDFLPLEAVKVPHPHNEHELLWKRSDTLNKRVTFINATLTLSNITASDAGTYKVLDRNNKTLITVTVEVNGTKDPEHRNGKDEPIQDSGSRRRRWLVIIPFVFVLIPIVLLFVSFLRRLYLSMKQSVSVV